MKFKKITGNYPYESINLHRTIPVVILSAAKNPHVPGQILRGECGFFAALRMTAGIIP